MTTAAHAYQEERIALAGTELYLLKGGEGRPLLVLHGVEGHEGWLPFHDALAAKATVYAPAHPGYGETARPEWLETIAHQAVFYHWFIERAGLAGWTSSASASAAGSPRRWPSRARRIWVAWCW